MTIHEAIQYAVRLRDAGKVAAAQSLLQQLLSLQVEDAESLHAMGLLSFRLQRYDSAIELIRRAITANPAALNFHINFGVALATAGQHEECVLACRKGLLLKEDSTPLLHNLGTALYRLGRYGESIQSLQRAIELGAEDYPTVQLLGDAFQQNGQLRQAGICFTRLLELRPNDLEALNKIGMLAYLCGEYDQAAKFMQQAIVVTQGLIDLYVRTADNFASVGRVEQSRLAQQESERLRQELSKAHFHLGNVLHRLNRSQDAIAAFEAAICLQPHMIQAQFNLGEAFLQSLQVDAAQSCFMRVCGLDPSHTPAQIRLSETFMAQNRMDEANACCKTAEAQSGRLWSLWFHPAYDSQTILREHREWNTLHAEPLRHLIQPHKNDRSPNRRLRIGYVSPDFRYHCQSLFTLPLFSSHDRTQLEIFCYADVNNPDALTKRHQSLADAWRSTVGLTDEQIAAQICDDQIDILVDLTMHMAAGRPLLFAQKPAPIQIAWLAYPGTTGLSAMDYRLTDPYLDPPGLHDERYTERSVRLAETFWCFDPAALELESPQTALPESGPLPASRNGFITFGSLNNFIKINDGILELWSRVLRAIPSSRLIMLVPNGAAGPSTVEKLSRLGVVADRIELFHKQPRRQYLAAYQRIDIGLDTLPANGHTTSLDSFWMGVPVITRIGSTAMGRAGFSFLSNLGLPELASDTDDEFVTIATQLANDLPRLAELRRTLRPRMAESPLMDAKRFAANIESAYRNAWRSWCAAAPLPPHLPIGSLHLPGEPSSVRQG